MNRNPISKSAYFLLAAALSMPGMRAQTTAGKKAKFEVTETTIAETREAIRSGKVTCRQVVEAYIQRIRKYDQSTRLMPL
jgi:amidase